MRLGYVIVYVPDVMKAVVFYERAFDLSRRFLHESGQYAEMETGPTVLAFVDEEFARGNVSDFYMLRPDQPPAAIEIALVTKDVTSAVSRAITAGCSVVKHPEEKPWGQTVAYVRDLNGILVELCSSIS